MNKTATLMGYEHRIQRVLDHIAAHPGQDHSLDGLAEIACFSPYHFHRIYRAIMRETVLDTLRRQRLHGAAAALLQAEDSLEQIARQAGYGSLAAFSRAFLAAYGIAPGAYRSQGLLVVPSPYQPVEDDPMSYSAEIRTTPTRHVARIAHKGDYQKIGTAFDKLAAWAGARNLFSPDSLMIGIFYDDPDGVPLDDLRSFACLTVPQETPTGGEVDSGYIEGGKFAVVRHKGPYAELPKAYAWLFREWLVKSGQETADAPCFEIYLNDPSSLPPAEWLTDIYLPLKG
ncbi:GyrI-like domain-containing protein [Lacibacterium aquatile]|uniref:GyrI-like domain-containing protein n=1 Tax=Lacibacterium aquatile TaxID=1168082 RepID=A0ABW5DMR9_9PROT